VRLIEALKPLLEKNKVEWIKDNLGMAIIGRYITDGSVPQSTRRHTENILKYVEHYSDDESATNLVKQSREKANEEVLFILNEISNIDPTPNNKYLQWLVRRYIDEDFLLFEDNEVVHETLSLFHDHKKHLNKKDINQYKTLPELGQAVRPFKGITKDEIKEKQFLDSGEAEIIYQDHSYEIIVPHTEAASRYYAKDRFGTEWCTAYPHNFNMYYDEGYLYIIHNKDSGEVIQVHFESDEDGEVLNTTIEEKVWQVKDINDVETDRRTLYSTNTAFKWLVTKRLFDKMEVKAENMTYFLFEVYHAIEEALIPSKMLMETIRKYPNESVQLIGNLISYHGEIPYHLDKVELAAVLPIEFLNYRLSFGTSDERGMYTITISALYDLDRYIDSIGDYTLLSDYLDGSAAESIIDMYDAEVESMEYRSDMPDSEKYERKAINVVADKIRQLLVNDSTTLEEFEGQMHHSIESFADLLVYMSNNMQHIGGLDGVWDDVAEAYREAAQESTEEYIKDDVEGLLHDEYGIFMDMKEDSDGDIIIPISHETAFNMAFIEDYDLVDDGTGFPPLTYDAAFVHPSIETLHKHLIRYFGAF